VPLSRRALAAALLVLAGCGGGEGRGAATPAPARSAALVDASKPPPLVNAFERDARSGEYLLTTNRGFFRIDPRTDRVRRIEATITAGSVTAGLGSFLEVSATRKPGVLLGSGHPNRADIPEYLGLIRSEDGGRTWTTVSRLGEADLHEIAERDGRIYAVDAVYGALLISADGGRTFREHPLPQGLVTSMVLDPADPRRILISIDDQVHRSLDEGRRWRPVLTAQAPRLVWPAAGPLLRADADGRVLRSGDAGSTWQAVGRIDGPDPQALLARDERRLAAALADGTIVESADGGASWAVAFKPS
jgi:hypothetical protein